MEWPKAMMMAMRADLRPHRAVEPAKGVLTELYVGGYRFEHGGVNRHVAKASKNHKAEDESHGADNETAHEEVASGNTAEEGNRIEPGQLEVGFTPRFLGKKRRTKRH